MQKYLKSGPWQKQFAGLYFRVTPVAGTRGWPCSYPMPLIGSGIGSTCPQLVLMSKTRWSNWDVLTYNVWGISVPNYSMQLESKLVTVRTLDYLEATIT